MFKQKTLPLMLVLLLVGHLALPFADASATSGRAGPDFAVTNMQFDGAGSVFTSSGLVLAPDTHTVRVDVENVGTSSGNAFLSLVHKGSPSAAEQIVDTVDLGTMPASSGPTTFLLSWTATTGPQQTLFARVSGANDGNPVNNEYRRDFDVDTLREMTIISDEFPSPAPGNTYVFLDRQSHTFNATIRNDGVMQASAVMGLILFNASTATTIEYWQASNTETVEPGSIYSPSAGEVLSAGFSATALAGLWNVSVLVWVNGSAGPQSFTHTEFDVIFSDYISEMVGPSDRTTAPGDSTTLYYIIKNTGSNDIFAISVSSVLGWADTTLVPTSTNPLAGELRRYSVSR